MPVARARNSIRGRTLNPSDSTTRSARNLRINHAELATEGGGDGVDALPELAIVFGLGLGDGGCGGGHGCGGGRVPLLLWGFRFASSVSPAEE